MVAINGLQVFKVNLSLWLPRKISRGVCEFCQRDPECQRYRALGVTTVVTRKVQHRRFPERLVLQSIMWQRAADSSLAARSSLSRSYEDQNSRTTGTRRALARLVGIAVGVLRR